MITVGLVVLGLVLGSFVNALVWRLHEQEKKPKAKNLSVLKGRSMCPHCRHELAAKDLVPLLSWLWLRGCCRYCSQPISPQYPLVEAATAGLFVVSYIWWAAPFGGVQTVLFVLWLALLTGLMALAVYDLKWFILPDRITYPLVVIAMVYAMVNMVNADRPLKVLLNETLAVAVGGGIFYLLFQLSAGTWIGGGDVKLGFLLGLLAGTPARSMLFIFIASLIGSVMSLPLIVSQGLKKKSVIPFGPFLVAGLVVVMLFGTDIINWYKSYFIG